MCEYASLIHSKLIDRRALKLRIEGRQPAAFVAASQHLQPLQLSLQPLQLSLQLVQLSRAASAAFRKYQNVLGCHGLGNRLVHQFSSGPHTNLRT